MNDCVYVGSRLPNDFIFYLNNDCGEGRNKASEKIIIKGAQKDRHFGSFHPEQQKQPKVLSNFHYGITEVNKEKWESVKKQLGESFSVFSSKAIIDAKNEKELDTKIIDLINSNVKTGFEGCSKEAHKIERFKADE